MSENWKIGDVALVTLEKPGFNARRGPGPHLMVRDMSGVKDVWRLAMTGIVHEESEVATARRLVVIDPEDLQQVERLWHEQQRGIESIREANPGQVGVSLIDALQVGLRRMSDPEHTPKPPEPLGLGAVVGDAEGGRWVRWKSMERKPWRLDYGVCLTAEANYAYYADINVVQIHSTGVL